MFKRISYRIALQFTAFVFLLLMVDGVVFFAADFGNARRQSQNRLERLSRLALQVQLSAQDPFAGLPPPLRDRVRILDAAGHPLYESNLLRGVPFVPKLGMSDISIQSEDYAVFTSAMLDDDGNVNGFVQVGEVDRVPQDEILVRVALYLGVSAAISALTFGVGLFFARRSLKPAEEMVQRLEQFTQDASHELRTPLAALSSSLDLALKTGKHREGILSAKDDLKEVSVLVERLLELARLDRFVLKRHRVDLSSLAEESLDKYRALAAEKHVTFDDRIAPGVTVTGDALLIRQIFGNLLANAIKFSKTSGGRVTVDVTKEAFSVADTGIGIAKADLAHIFNRFYQAEASRSKDGFGLGLALVKRIAELHGWTAEVESEAGKGTTFRVRFGKEG